MKKFDVKVVITRKQYLKLAFTLIFKKEKQFHNYSKESNYFENSNNSFVGKMKDEACGVPLNIFVGLKVKMYTFITEENDQSKKSKELNNYVVDVELKYEDFKNIFFNNSHMRHEMIRIKSKDHNIASYRISKVSLPRYDDRKYMSRNGYSRFFTFFINLLVNNTKIILSSVDNSF